MGSEIPLSVDGRTAIGAISWGMAGSLLREGEMCIMFYNETIVASPLSRDPADDQIVEGRGRIRLGPQTDPPRAEARVAVVEQQCSVEPALYVVADGDHTKQKPLTHGRRLHGRARELSPATVVVVEAEVVLERIRGHAPAARRVRGFIDGPAPGRRGSLGGHDRGPGGSGRRPGHHFNATLCFRGPSQPDVAVSRAAKEQELVPRAARARPARARVRSRAGCEYSSSPR